MWEAGSHLNALIAAVDLGVIADDDFTARTGALLGVIARGAQKRLALPPETIDSETGKATTRFNSFDTARLLVAMHRLKVHRLAPKGLEDLVASWAFAEVIIDRRLHSFRERLLIDDFASNYAITLRPGCGFGGSTSPRRWTRWPGWLRRMTKQGFWQRRCPLVFWGRAQPAAPFGNVRSAGSRLSGRLP